MVPLYCEGCSLWVRLDQWPVKVSWLGELTAVFWWMEFDHFSLECSEVSSSAFWGVYVFGMAWATCLLMLRAVFLLCWRISMGCLALELVSSWFQWSLGGALFQCRCGDFWVSSCLLMFPEIRSSLMFSSFGVKPPISGFQSHSFSSLKTFPSIHHR